MIKLLDEMGTALARRALTLDELIARFGPLESEAGDTRYLQPTVEGLSRVVVQLERGGVVQLTLRGTLPSLSEVEAQFGVLKKGSPQPPGQPDPYMRSIERDGAWFALVCRAFPDGRVHDVTLTWEPH